MLCRLVEESDVPICSRRGVLRWTRAASAFSMYVQQWQAEGLALQFCGVAVDSQATLVRVRRVLISAYLLGMFQLALGARDFYETRAYLALIPVAVGVLVIGCSHVGAKERNAGLMGGFVCLNCISMVLVVLGLAAAAFGYLAFKRSTVEIQACCPKLQQCDWAQTGCACNATFAGGRDIIQFLPTAAPACNTSSSSGGDHHRHGREDYKGPHCLDQHECDRMTYEVAHPFVAVCLPFLVALLPCLPALAGCCFGVSLCRDPGHVKGLSDTYVNAPMGTSTNSASVSSVVPTHAIGSRLPGTQVTNPYPTMTRAQQRQQQEEQDYRGYRSPREDTIGL
eukprot:COSAG02_NODE_161_length_32629_cov_10.363142_4_plen_338_part_00